MTDYNDYRNRCLQDIVQMYGQECNYEEICQKTDMMMNNDTFYKEMTQKAYEDPYCRVSSENYSRYMTEHSIDHIFYYRHGGHEAGVWNNGLYNFLRRIF